MANPKNATAPDAPATVDPLAAFKKNAQRVDNVRWWSPFDVGDYIVFRLDHIEAKTEGSDDSAKFFGVTVDGDLFQSFAPVVVLSSLTHIAPGSVVLIEYRGKRQHPKDAKKTIRDYEIYNMGTEFPADCPSPDFEAIAARIAAQK